MGDYRVRQLAGWYLHRADAERRDTGAIRQAELDEALRTILVENEVFPEFMAAEFERVMRAVLGS